MIVANIKFDKSKFTKEKAKNWAKRHGYRITLLEETNDSYIFWQDNQEWFNQIKTTQHIRDGIIATIADGKKQIFFEGVYPEEDPNGKVYIVKSADGDLFRLRAKSIAHAEFIVSKNENIPIENLVAIKEGGWYMGIGGQRQDIPNNPQKRATPPGDIHNYPKGKPPEDMMKSDVDVKHKDIKDEIDELKRKIFQLAKDKKPIKLVSKDEEPIEQDDYFQINEDAKLSPSAGYDIPGGDEYMTGHGAHWEEQSNVIATFDNLEDAKNFIGNDKTLTINRTLGGKFVVVRKAGTERKEEMQIVYEAGVNTYYD